MATAIILRACLVACLCLAGCATTLPYRPYPVAPLQAPAIAPSTSAHVHPTPISSPRELPGVSARLERPQASTVPTGTSGDARAISDPCASEDADEQVNFLFEEYKCFRYTDVLARAPLIMDHPCLDARGKATALLIVAASAYVLGARERCIDYLLLAHETAPSLAPNPIVFPGAFCALYQGLRTQEIRGVSR